MAEAFSAGLWQKFRNAVCKDNIATMQTIYDGSSQPELYITTRHRDADWNMGDTALGLAAERGSPAAAQWLLDRGADIETVNNHGSTPLVWASCLGRMAVVRSLVEAGADVNRVTHGRDRHMINYDSRPMVNAMPEAIVYLLQHGALPLASGCVATTAKDRVQLFARCSCHPDNANAPAPVTPVTCVQKLKLQFMGGRPWPAILGGAAAITPPVRPVLSGTPEGFLFDAGANVDHRGEVEQSLAIAVAMRCKPIIRYGVQLMGIPMHPAVQQYVLQGRPLPADKVQAYAAEEHPEAAHSSNIDTNALVQQGAVLPWRFMSGWHGPVSLEARSAELVARNEAAVAPEGGRQEQRGDVVQLWELSGEELCAALVDGLTHIHGVLGAKGLATEAAVAHRRAKADGAAHGVVYTAMHLARNTKKAAAQAAERALALQQLTGEHIDDVGLLCVRAVLAVLLRKYGNPVVAMVQARGKGEFLEQLLADARVGWVDRRELVLCRVACRAAPAAAAGQAAAAAAAAAPQVASIQPARGVKRGRSAAAPTQRRSTRSRRG